MRPISAWTATAQEDLEQGELLHKVKIQGYVLKLFSTDDSLWIVAHWSQGGRIAFRVAYAPNDKFTIQSKAEKEKFTLVLEGVTGIYKVHIRFPEADKAIFHYTTFFTPAFDTLVPYWPRDIMPLFKNGKVQNSAGIVHAVQIGTRSGAMFFSLEKPVGGSVFYFQNLTALADYCEATETSSAELIGGQWPEIGFKLPEAITKPLPAGKEFIISDAYVLLSDEVPEDNFEMTQQYINHLAGIYLHLPLPTVSYHDWPDTLKKGLKDLAYHKGCWKFADGRHYLNAYVADYETPPEVMVQLAVLLPLLEYDEWSGEDTHEIIQDIKDGIANFYDPKLQTIVRWLPALEDKLDRSEEQKQPRIMDSWYLHHPLMNLSRRALEGDKEAEELLMKSIEYVIKVAHHFDYEWPVFYRMDTLEIIKKETAKGKGGEKDVPGAYAHLMIQVWKLTGEQRYFNEAKRAAKNLEGLGFDLFYQANNTAFSAGALLRLYKETKDKLYLNLSYVCIASILKNVQLWDCNYGNAKQYPTFFAVYPLSDAPYTAAYEEQEVFAGMHSFLREARDIEEVLPSVKLLLAEFVKYAVYRLCYYFPPFLPPEILSEDIRTGEIDPNLWIAIEDLRDGWEKSGQVGQEVYGAGVAFGIVPRQYFKVTGEDFMIFTNYPAYNFVKRDNAIFLSIDGSEKLSCSIVVTGTEKLPELKLSVTEGQKTEPVVIKPTSARAEFTVTGNSRIKIEWSK